MGQKDYSRAVDGTVRNAMIMPVGKPAMLTPAFTTDPHKVVVPPMPISKIPVAMRRMGWSVSAALMEHWFCSPAWQLPEQYKDNVDEPLSAELDSAHVDEGITKMAWALSFDRFATKYHFLAGRWRVPAAVAVLLMRLRQAGWDGVSDMQLGQASMSARALDRISQMNATSVGGLADTLDDFYGALGYATLKMAAVGRAFVDTMTGRRMFHMQKCGCYIKDFYDFNGFQYLGLWTESGILSKATMVVNSVSDGILYQWRGDGIGHVYNEHFQNYRKQIKKGGDFQIYSDVMWLDVDGYLDLEDAIAADPGM